MAPGSLWSLANMSFLSSATSSVRGEGSGRVSGRQKEGENRIFGGCVSQYCYQTEINPVCGSFSIVTLTFSLTFPEHPDWRSGLTLYIHVITSPPSAVREG